MPLLALNWSWVWFICLNPCPQQQGRRVDAKIHTSDIHSPLPTLSGSHCLYSMDWSLHPETSWKQNNSNTWVAQFWSSGNKVSLWILPFPLGSKQTFSGSWNPSGPSVDMRPPDSSCFGRSGTFWLGGSWIPQHDGLDHHSCGTCYLSICASAKPCL
jgi:hypothetical protein